MLKKTHVHKASNFKGKSGSDCKKKRKSSRRERAMKRGTHKNKYRA